MRNNISKILTGVGISIGSTLILLFAFSCILAYTNISEVTIAPVIIVITGISILIGSSIITFKIRKNGIVNGMIIGGIYIITLYLISSLIYTGFSINGYSIFMILIGILSGAIGGIVGVNLK